MIRTDEVHHYREVTATYGGPELRRLLADHVLKQAGLPSLPEGLEYQVLIKEEDKGVRGFEPCAKVTVKIPLEST